MHAYPFLYTQADGTNLFSFDPNSGVTLIPIRFDRKIFQGSYHDLFEIPNIEVKGAPLVAQGENGVAYELTRTMIGNLASSINEKKGESGLSHLLVGDENVIQAARPADGDGRRMFQEEQEIRDFPLDSLMMKPSLQLPSLPIFHYPKIPNITHLLNTVSMWLLLSTGTCPVPPKRDRRGQGAQYGRNFLCSHPARHRVPGKLFDKLRAVSSVERPRPVGGELHNGLFRFPSNPSGCFPQGL